MNKTKIKLISGVFNFLLLLAPIIAFDAYSVLVFGEPKCPKHLTKSKS